MDKSALYKLWRHFLIDVGKSEGEVAREATNATTSALNQKARNGSFRFIDFVNILEHYGYSIQIGRKNAGIMATTGSPELGAGIIGRGATNAGPVIITQDAGSMATTGSPELGAGIIGRGATNAGPVIVTQDAGSMGAGIMARAAAKDAGSMGQAAADPQLEK